MVTRPGPGSPFGFLDVILMFFFWLVGQAVSIWLIMLMFGIEIEDLNSASGDTKSWAAIVMACGQLVATLLAVGVFLIRYRQPSVVGCQPENLRRDLVIGMFAFAMVIPSLLFLQWLLVLVFAYEHPTMDLLAENANGLTLLATWFSAVIVAPICEEVFFRGVLQSWLQRLGRGTSDCVLTGGWDSQSSSAASTRPKPTTGAESNKLAQFTDAKNPFESPSNLAQQRPTTDSDHTSWTSDAIWPILVTSVLFGLAHSGQGPAPISLFVFGIALGYIFRRTGSIVPCIVLHMMLNAFSMFWFTLQVFFGEPAATVMLEQVHSVINVF